MKKNVVLIGVIISLLCLFNTAYAERTIWYVHPDSSLNTIQAGLESCADNDIVLVAPGTYVENITWPNTQGIHLLSELGPDTTIIDGDSIGSVIVCATGIDTTTIISGFTIQHGYCSEGGGINCSESSPFITNNIIVDNVSYIGGGICCIYNSSPIITNNTITCDTAFYWGGGIYCCFESSPMITNNIITNNTATPASNGDHGVDVWHEYTLLSVTGKSMTNRMGYAGGGIACDYGCSSIITNNTITDNTTVGGGGGIFCGYDSSIIANNTITGNIAGSGGGIAIGYNSSAFITGNTVSNNIAYYGGGIECWGSQPFIINNTITGNTTNMYGGGIFCHYSSAIIDSCTISNNNGDGVYCEMESSPVIHYCNITDNTGYGVRNVDSSVTVNAEYNWWGDSTGPGGVGPGTGDEVSEYVDYEPWLFASVGIEEETKSQKPEARLMIYPNPFSTLTHIKFQAPSSKSQVTMSIYDAAGRVIKDFSLPSAYSLLPTEVSWNGVSNAGQKLPCGVYFLEFQVGDYKETRKLLLVR